MAVVRVAASGLAAMDGDALCPPGRFDIGVRANVGRALRNEVRNRKLGLQWDGGVDKDAVSPKDRRAVACAGQGGFPSEVLRVLAPLDGRIRERSDSVPGRSTPLGPVVQLRLREATHCAAYDEKQKLSSHGDSTLLGAAIGFNVCGTPLAPTLGHLFTEASIGREASEV